MSMLDKVPMTVLGQRQLQDELEQLQREKIPETSRAIAEARALGDLKENAEYHAARERQSFLKGRMEYVAAQLNRAEVIDVTKLPNRNRVVFGVTVRLWHVGQEQEVVYQIVGEDEADIKQKKLSCTSPIARALMGASVDDEVTVETPSGEVQFQVLQVDHL